MNVFCDLLLLNDELLDCGLDSRVEKVILPLLGFPPRRSASFLNTSYKSFGSTGYDSLGVAVPLLVIDDIFELP